MAAQHLPTETAFQVQLQTDPFKVTKSLRTMMIYSCLAKPKLLPRKNHLLSKDMNEDPSSKTFT